MTSQKTHFVLFSCFTMAGAYFGAGCGSSTLEAPAGSGGSAGEVIDAGGESDAQQVDDAGPPIVDDDFPLPLTGGLAPTPPMGWNSWNAYHCSVTAALVMRTADVMVAAGLAEAGYQYINIDDCWAQTDRAADGSIQVAPNFPNGIKPVADYVHSKGFKLGIYSDRGTQTCGGRAGSQDHEEQDAQTYASWGVDYLKYDNCSALLDKQTQYQKMRDALHAATAATGRPIVFSICAWAFDEWDLGTGELWRTTSDITPTWASILSNASVNRRLAAYAAPNGWNDPDMLEVGSGAMSTAEDRAHFSLWAMMAAPLIAGNDMTTLSSETREILSNKEVIAVDQDGLGIQGVPVELTSSTEVWFKPLNESGARAVLLLNRGTAAADITVHLSEIGLRASHASVRDLWAHADAGFTADDYTATVEPHDVAMVKIIGSELPAPTGSAYLSDLPWIYAASASSIVTRDYRNASTAPISINGQTYDKGLGVYAGSMILYRLGQACTRFSADVGVDVQGKSGGSVIFRVLADGEMLFDSGLVTGGTPPQSISVDVTGKRRLKLVATNGGDGSTNDYADWGNAKLDCAVGP